MCFDNTLRRARLLGRCGLVGSRALKVAVPNERANRLAVRSIHSNEELRARESIARPTCFRLDLLRDYACGTRVLSVLREGSTLSMRSSPETPASRTTPARRRSIAQAKQLATRIEKQIAAAGLGGCVTVIDANGVRAQLSMTTVRHEVDGNGTHCEIQRVSTFEVTLSAPSSFEGALPRHGFKKS